jgi:hypothetical protein
MGHAIAAEERRPRGNQWMVRTTQEEQVLTAGHRSEAIRIGMRVMSGKFISATPLGLKGGLQPGWAVPQEEAAPQTRRR